MRALVTGGSRGIGRAVCEKLRGMGFEVFAPSRAELDLGSNRSVLSFCKKYAGETFDIIINNAGINPLAEIDEVSPDVLDEIMTVNLKSPILLLKGFVPQMKVQKYGRIVNISSIWGLVSKAGRVQYSATKYGINGVTNTLAVELGGYNILVNSVCPGFTATEMTAQNVPPALEAELCRDIPLGRFAKPEEIAGFIAYLASPENTYITGQIIAVDGGFTAR